ncbi:MAG: hypothetical protein GY906_20740 [bacterium]|nr:hypothetical protein [bacterium]
MIVSAWHDGHGSYGLRVAGDGVGLWFRPEWRWVTVHLPGEKAPASIMLTPSFWESSPELRSPRLKVFFEREGLIPWPKNRPPQFELEPIGGGGFRLRSLGSQKQVEASDQNPVNETFAELDVPEEDGIE